MDYTDPLARTGQHLDDTLVILDDMRRTVEALDARLAALIDDLGNHYRPAPTSPQKPVRHRPWRRWWTALAGITLLATLTGCSTGDTVEGCRAEIIKAATDDPADPADIEACDGLTEGEQGEALAGALPQVIADGFAEYADGLADAFNDDELGLDEPIG